jgi:hypothetical protein
LQIGVIDNQKLERGAAVQWIHQLKKPWSVPYYCFNTLGAPKKIGRRSARFSD